MLQVGQVTALVSFLLILLITFWGCDSKRKEIQCNTGDECLHALQGDWYNAWGSWGYTFTEAKIGSLYRSGTTSEYFNRQWWYFKLDGATITLYEDSTKSNVYEEFHIDYLSADKLKMITPLDAEHITYRPVER